MRTILFSCETGRFPRHRSTGFTLIELLVVISIIALLVAILLPALKAARQTAEAASCLSNLRQQAIGINAYVNEYRGFFPIGIDDVSWTGDWSQALAGYMKNGDMTWSSGEDPNGAFLCPSAEIDQGKVHYAANPRIMREMNRLNRSTSSSWWMAPLRIDVIERPTEAGMTFDSGQQNNGNTYSTANRLDNWEDAGPSTQLVFNPATADDPVEASSGSALGDIRYRHASDTVGNLNFVDGHAKAFQNGTVLQRHVRLSN